MTFAQASLLIDYLVTAFWPLILLWCVFFIVGCFLLAMMYVALFAVRRGFENA
jgi:hypothetical protein